MITDLLMAATFIVEDLPDGEELDVGLAVETIVENADREVSDEEREELREVLESDWVET